MSEWQPLTDIFDEYNSSLDTAVSKGYIDDPEIAQDYVWPVELDISESEQKDVQKYVQERTVDIVERLKTERVINAQYLAGHVFRSVICGMLWEKERRG